MKSLNCPFRAILIILCIIAGSAFILFGFSDKCAALDRQYINKHIAVYGGSNLLRDYGDRIAKEYSILITEWWKYRDVLRIKRQNPEIKILFYRDLIGVRTDYDDWSVVKNHKDWFVTDVATGKRVRHRTFQWYLMDITNKDFRRHFLKYIKDKLRKHGKFDGVFLDDVPKKVDPTKFYAEGLPIQNPPDFGQVFNAKYYSALTSFLKELKRAIGEKLLFANTNDRDDLVQQVDGVMFEGFIHGSWQERDRFPTLAEWRNDLTHLQGLIKTNKNVLVHSGSVGRRFEVHSPFIFSLTSFLLCATDKTTFSFDISSKDGKLQHFAEYDLQIGKPVEDPTIVRNGKETKFEASNINTRIRERFAIRRGFERATVVVNPGIVASQFTPLPVGHPNAEASRREVSISPRSGIILSN